MTSSSNDTYVKYFSHQFLCTVHDFITLLNCLPQPYYGLRCIHLEIDVYSFLCGCVPSIDMNGALDWVFYVTFGQLTLNLFPTSK